MSGAVFLLLLVLVGTVSETLPEKLLICSLLILIIGKQCAALDDENSTCRGRDLKHLVHLLGEQQIKKVSLIFVIFRKWFILAYFHASFDYLSRAHY